MPSLIRDACKEGLPVLMASDHDRIMGCSVDGKLFAVCVTDRKMKLPAGRTIEEVDLDNAFFHEMIVAGYGGLAVETMGNVYCIPWSDIFSGKPVTNVERRLQKESSHPSRAD
jgi:hypothetical protein